MSSISGLGNSSAWSQMQTQMRSSHVDRQQKASEAFAKIDTTNQGYFDESGFETAINQALTNAQSNKSYSSDRDGKVTQQEFTSALSQLRGRHHHQEAGKASDGDNNMSGMGNMQGMGRMQGMGDMPPPPPGDAQNNSGSDQGFTVDELKAQLSAIGTSDAKRATLINDVVSNFSKADTDGNGKVNFQEAMALEKSLKFSSSSDTNASATVSSATNTASPTDAAQQKFMLQLMKMIEAYGQSVSASNSRSSSLSVTA
jgi:Ca2+-binding EF-hand superfamily protein